MLGSPAELLRQQQEYTRSEFNGQFREAFEQASDSSRRSNQSLSLHDIAVLAQETAERINSMFWSRYTNAPVSTPSTAALRTDPVIEPMTYAAPSPRFSPPMFQSGFEFSNHASISFAQQVATPQMQLLTEESGFDFSSDASYVCPNQLEPLLSFPGDETRPSQP